jgi:hypothetical protein
MAAITVKQMENIFIAMETSGGDSRLRKLRIRSYNLSRVQPDLLAKAVNKLENVALIFTGLTKKQVEAILTQSLVKTSLKMLHIASWPSMVLDRTLMSQASQAIELIVT